MDRRWPDEARSFAESVSGALRRLGGVEFTRRAEADPSLRGSELAPVLDALGFDEIDVLGSGADAQAAAAAAQVAGACVAPWPLAATLARMPDGGDPVYLTLGAPARLEHLDLFGRALAVDLRTRAATVVTAVGEPRRMPLDPFGVACHPHAGDGAPTGDPALSRAVDAHVVLTAYYVLGALQTATRLTAVYARERHQFGRSIGEFGAIQWRLSDIVVSRDGLEELAGFTLWRFCEGTVTPADTLALRLAMIEAAERVLANGHQVFGAIGLCEEHDLTVIDRHLQALLRRPTGLAVTSRLLRDAVVAHGFDGVFSLAPRDAAAPVSREAGPGRAGR